MRTKQAVIHRTGNDISAIYLSEWTLSLTVTRDLNTICTIATCQKWKPANNSRRRMVPQWIWLPSIPRTSPAARQTRGRTRTKSHTNVVLGQRLTVLGGYSLFLKGASFVPKVRPFHLPPVFSTPLALSFFLPVDVRQRPGWVTLEWTVGTSIAVSNNAVRKRLWRDWRWLMAN